MSHFCMNCQCLTDYPKNLDQVECLSSKEQKLNRLNSCKQNLHRVSGVVTGDKSSKKKSNEFG